MPKVRQSRGQVLIITAFAMIVLLAIAAIVVDLGFSWMLHRKEQNAADPGSLAAAKWINPTVDQAKMEAEACFYAKENGFFAGDANCAAALASGDLDVNSPPSSALSGEWRGFKGYVEVIITSTHPSFFGQIFGRPVASVRTAAVAANTPGNANSASLTALGHDCTNANNDNGVSTVSGGGTVHIFPARAGITSGGYVQVNASCGNTDDLCANGSGTNALKISGQLVADAPLPAPFVNTVGGCSYQGTGLPQPRCQTTSPSCLDEGAIPLGDPLSLLPEPWPFLNLTAPACPRISGPINVNGPSDTNPCTLKGGNNGTCPLVGAIYTCTMQPGVYYAGWDVQSNVKVVLKPGMYVFAGFGIKLSNNSSMETVSDVAADGITPIEARITIFSTDYTAGCLANKQNFCEGDVNITAQGALNLKATDETSCLLVSPTICTWRGILIWQDATVVRTPGNVTITGTSDLILSGTIYAAESHVKISGGNGSTGCTGTPKACLAIQIISESWDINGNATVDMPYDPDELFQLVQRGLVH